MTKEIQLTERDLKIRQQQLDETELTLIKLNIQGEQMAKSIKEELPMKEARLILRKIQAEIETAEQNVKAYTKQIREKKMSISE